MGVQAAAAIGVTVAAGTSHRDFYGPWLAATLAVLAIRLVIDRVLVASLHGRFIPTHLDFIAKLFSAGLLVSAALWAFLACVRFPIDDVHIRYVIIVVLSALAGGATGVLSPLKLTGRLYITMILLPASLTMILAQHSDEVLGVLGSVFWLVMLNGHRNNHDLLVDAIKLRDENRDLLSAVARRSHDLDCLNRDLEDRVASRTRELEEARSRAQAANDAKSRFLAAMSHEMRTPLNAILGLGQILTRSGLRDPQREQVLDMKAAARRLRQMVDDVMDLSRLDDGALALEPEPFCLSALAQSLDDIHRPAIEAKGLRFTMLLEAAAGETRLGDVRRLRQVIGQLIHNALKFTQQGGVDCHIVGEGDDLRIEIIDTGQGFAPEMLEVIFERFSQADDSATREFGGMGLGLALCRSLTERMGGAISAKSTPGAGSVFTLRISCPLTDRQEANSTVGSETPQDGEAHSLLVVDDNAVNRRILAALVEPFGIECGFAADGQEAVEAWRKRPWDAIFMDVHMPIMNGMEAARTIRAEEQVRGRSRVPIVAVTASLTEEETTSYRAAGMDDVLPKPIEAAALADMIIRCVGAS